MINRHNYEEFLLLYVDKELDADGQAAVETFVSQNPDLAKELELLQQATLTDDDIHFKQKEILYRKENSISLANYEEYFLLSADNELNEQQAAKVENFVLKHPRLQHEFMLLHQTRLQPEFIEFAGKEKLYRKDKKVRRIIPLALVRMGAAAAIAGVVYMSFIVFDNNRSSHINTVTATAGKTVKKAETNHNQTIQKPETEKPAALSYAKKENANNIKIATANRRKKKINTAKTKERQAGEEAVALNKPVNKRERQIAQLNTDISQHDIQYPEAAAAARNRNDFKNSKKQELVTPDINNALEINEQIVKEDRLLVTHAVYLEAENAEQEKTVYIGSAEINKNKLKGLLKKAAVFFNSKIRGNDNNDN